jgi:glutaconate CoA-transferase subunit A
VGAPVVADGATLWSERCSGLREFNDDLCAAISRIPDGALIGLGGFNLQNKPMSAVWEIVRQGKRALTVVCAAPASIDADLLIGAGCVREIIVQSLSLERFGPVGPAFRRAAESGSIRIIDLDQGCVVAGLRAAAYGLDSLGVRAAAGTDFERVAPDWFRSTSDPFTGAPVVAVRAIRPDFALIHANRADDAGHVQHLGSDFNDALLCQASAQVIFTVERRVTRDDIVRNAHRTISWAHNTAAICLQPGGAAPTAAHGEYGYDAEHLREYANLVRDHANFDDVLARLRKPTPEHLPQC